MTKPNFTASLSIVLESEFTKTHINPVISLEFFGWNLCSKTPSLLIPIDKQRKHKKNITDLHSRSSTTNRRLLTLSELEFVNLTRNLPQSRLTALHHAIHKTSIAQAHILTEPILTPNISSSKGVYFRRHFPRPLDAV